MSGLELNPNLAKQFLEALYSPFYCQAPGPAYLEVRGKREGEDLSFRRFYLTIEALVNDIPKWPPDLNYWLAVGLRKNNQGGKKNNVLALPAFFGDMDAGVEGHRKAPWKNKAEALAAIEQFPLRPTMLIESGGGFQPYWLLKSPLIMDNGNLRLTENVLKGLAQRLNGDAMNVAQILRLPGTFNMKLADTPRPVKIVWIEPDRVYDLAELRQYEAKPKAQAQVRRHDPQGAAGDYEAYAQTALADELAKLARTPEASHNRNIQLNQSAFALGQLVGAGVLDRGSVEAALCGVAVAIGLTETETRATIKSGIEGGMREPRELLQKNKTHIISPKIEIKCLPSWPGPLAREAFHGLAGDFVRGIEPHTEADPIALLSQFLTYFGNVIGPAGPYYQVEGDYHYLKLFLNLVGDTSKARKGTSHGHIQNIYREVDPQWTRTRIVGGLSSGEGLIWGVRDPISKREPVKEKGKHTGDYQEIEVDPGEADKRLLVYEPEFATVLKVMGREGNTLSDVIRKAWDGTDLRTLTKNTPAKATGTHISIIGHITAEELRRYLDKTEMANGLGNRFIWLCVRRSKVLPHGGSIETVNFSPLIQRLTGAVEFARKAGRVSMAPDTAERWEAVYGPLSEGKPGLTGALIARGEAQVVRLASIYALLDQSTLILPEHLQAALALWNYAEASVKFIFGNALGDPVADQIISALKFATNGLTRTEISNHFGRHVKSGRIVAALDLLYRHNLVRVEQIPDTGGRMAERWFYTAN